MQRKDELTRVCQRSYHGYTPTYSTISNLVRVLPRTTVLVHWFRVLLVPYITVFLSCISE
jgi:hypothetical protein